MPPYRSVRCTSPTMDPTYLPTRPSLSQHPPTRPELAQEQQERASKAAADNPREQARGIREGRKGEGMRKVRGGGEGGGAPRRVLGVLLVVASLQRRD
eukprot:3832034-Rhodomonas_salina.1